jgi:hypothetical protein
MTGIRVDREGRTIWRLEAELAAAPVARLLAPGMEARIFQLSRRSANLVTEEGEIFSLIESGLEPGPFSIQVRLDKRPGFSLEQMLGSDFEGLKAKVSDECLFVGQVGISLSSAQIWDPTLVQGRLCDKQVCFSVSRIREVLDRRATSDSLPRQLAAKRASPIGLRIGQAWEQLRLAIERAEPRRCSIGAQHAAGAGIGLTPAGDDFLMGVLLALWLGLKNPGRYMSSLLAGAAGRTGRLSMAFLNASGRGQAGQAWHLLVGALAEDDVSGISAATTVILGAGHTSGADALCGFTLALEAIGCRPAEVARPI